MAWHNVFMKKIILLASLFALASPTVANDSSAAIGLGGLELTRNDAISMDSEELFLSRERVTVKYRFTNSSTKDVETLVSFPLPAIPSGVDEYLGDQAYPDWSTSLEFKTTVDGKAVKLDMREVVTIIGKPEGGDVSARLRTLGWPVKHWVDYKFEETLQDLPDAQKAALVAEGLLRKDEDGPYVRPNWQVATHVTRSQRFPAGRTIMVEHSYKPVMGGSVGGALERTGRKEDYFKSYSASYCIDKAFLKGFDKRRYSGRKDSDGNDVGQFYVEHWLDYVLKSGANWKGPIKDFRLVIDKGKADNLVSFCMTGVKKIGPTQFEVRKTNFEPAKDLNILIVEWAPID
jgi:Domain of unknown function (DUF4424)